MITHLRRIAKNNSFLDKNQFNIYTREYHKVTFWIQTRQVSKDLSGLAKKMLISIIGKHICSIMRNITYLAVNHEVSICFYIQLTLLK